MFYTNRLTASLRFQSLCSAKLTSPRFILTIQTWKWHQFSHLTLTKKPNKHIAKNVKLFVLTLYSCLSQWTCSNSWAAADVAGETENWTPTCKEESRMWSWTGNNQSTLTQWTLIVYSQKSQLDLCRLAHRGQLFHVGHLVRLLCPGGGRKLQWITNVVPLSLETKGNCPAMSHDISVDLLIAFGYYK